MSVRTRAHTCTHARTCAPANNGGRIEKGAQACMQHPQSRAQKPHTSSRTSAGDTTNRSAGRAATQHTQLDAVPVEVGGLLQVRGRGCGWVGVYECICHAHVTYGKCASKFTSLLHVGVLLCKCLRVCPNAQHAARVRQHGLNMSSMCFSMRQAPCLCSLLASTP